HGADAHDGELRGDRRVRDRERGHESGDASHRGLIVVRKSGMRNRIRLVFVAIFLACAMLIGIALYMQEQEGLEPCPMCILQRYAFVAIGAVALVAAIHGPQGMPLRAYSALVVLLAIAGGGVSARHSYLQHFPPKIE